jgi:HSP20 family protein
MFAKKEAGLTKPAARDPFALLREMTDDFDRWFQPGVWPAFPAFRTRSAGEALAWVPEIDVFERDNRLVTRIDLPGLKKEEVKVEVTDHLLTISGERKQEVEEKKEHIYRCEREFGRFVRTIPLPEGVTLGDVKATFNDGVLEVTIPLPARPEAKVRSVTIEEGKPAAKTAA